MRNKIYTLVSNARITFAKTSPGGGMRPLSSVDINDFIEGTRLEALLGEVKGSHNELLVVPDFWIGVKFYPISSGKRSVVEPFIKRKLRSDEPDVTEVENFFDYVKVHNDQGQEGAQVYHFQEAFFSRLYQRLADCGLSPRRVTTPGLLWEEKLTGLVPDFSSGATFLAHLVDSECFFYFFHHGRYVFSRDISISENLPVDDRIDALSFEIDQSRFLFSQKTKAEIDRICLASSGQIPISASLLAGRLGRDVSTLPIGVPTDALSKTEELHALQHFSAKELAISSKQLNLSHRLVRQELEWRPVQVSGLTIGIVALLILMAQAFFLQWWPAKEWRQVDSRKQAQMRQSLRTYNSNLDQILQESRRPVFSDVITRLAVALPDNLRLVSFAILSQPQSALELEARVQAANAEQFKKTLSRLSDNIKAEFGPAVSLDTKNIEFESHLGDGLDGGQYHIKLRCNLQ